MRSWALAAACVASGSCATVEPPPAAVRPPIVRVERCRYDPFAEGPGVGAKVMLAAMAVFVPSSLRREEPDPGIREIVCDEEIRLDGVPPAWEVPLDPRARMRIP